MPNTTSAAAIASPRQARRARCRPSPRRAGRSRDRRPSPRRPAPPRRWRTRRRAAPRPRAASVGWRTTSSHFSHPCVTVLENRNGSTLSITSTRWTPNASALRSTAAPLCGSCRFSITSRSPPSRAAAAASMRARRSSSSSGARRRAHGGGIGERRGHVVSRRRAAGAPRRGAPAAALLGGRKTWQPNVARSSAQRPIQKPSGGGPGCVTSRSPPSPMHSPSQSSLPRHFLPRVLGAADTARRRLDAVLAEHAVARAAALLRRRASASGAATCPASAFCAGLRAQPARVSSATTADRRRRGNASPRHRSRIAISSRRFFGKDVRCREYDPRVPDASVLLGAGARPSVLACVAASRRRRARSPERRQQRKRRPGWNRGPAWSGGSGSGGVRRRCGRHGGNGRGRSRSSAGRGGSASAGAGGQVAKWTRPAPAGARPGRRPRRRRRGRAPRAAAARRRARAAPPAPRPPSSSPAPGTARRPPARTPPTRAPPTTKCKTDIVTSDGAGGFLRVRRPNSASAVVNSTVSEGIAYGMLLAVYARRSADVRQVLAIQPDPPRRQRADELVHRPRRQQRWAPAPPATPTRTSRSRWSPPTRAGAAAAA